MKHFPRYPSSEVDRQTDHAWGFSSVGRGAGAVYVRRVYTGGVRRTLKRDFRETLEAARWTRVKRGGEKWGDGCIPEQPTKTIKMCKEGEGGLAPGLGI